MGLFVSGDAGSNALKRLSAGVDQSLVVFVNGDVVSILFKRFSAGGLRLIPGISIIQDIVGVLIIFRIDFSKQLYNLNKFQKMSPMGASD